jgi:hypothetical protein
MAAYMATSIDGAQPLPPARGEVAARAAFTSTDRLERAVSPPLEPYN